MLLLIGRLTRTALYAFSYSASLCGADPAHATQSHGLFRANNEQIRRAADFLAVPNFSLRGRAPSLFDSSNGRDNIIDSAVGCRHPPRVRGS
jgi:hypothetical protein